MAQLISRKTWENFGTNSMSDTVLSQNTAPSWIGDMYRIALHIKISTFSILLFLKS